MIKVLSNVQLVDSLKLALETGSTESFVREFVRLDEMFGRSDVEIQIRMDLPPCASLLYWTAHRIEDGKAKEDTFYSGGVCYNSNSNEWSINS